MARNGVWIGEASPDGRNVDRIYLPSIDIPEARHSRPREALRNHAASPGFTSIPLPGIAPHLHAHFGLELSQRIVTSAISTDGLVDLVIDGLRIFGHFSIGLSE